MPSLVRPNGDADAANGHRGVARIRRIELDGRDQFLHAIDVERSRVSATSSAAQDRERNGHLLRNLFDAPRGHDDRPSVRRAG